MAVVWTTAFLDLPPARHAAGVAFWCAVTATTPSATRGDEGQFATLVPAEGDAYLRVQRLGDVPRVHLDLHVEDLDAHTALAERLGATLVLRAGHVVLVSPGGFVFCLVRDRGERTRPAPVTGALGAVAIVDQVCLDVPPDAFEVEGAFWSALTGWALHAGSRPEFAALERPAGIPLRFLLQRLDDPGPRRSVTAHLDLACGGGQAEVAAEHTALGARVVGAGQWWTVMRDPAGASYCLTPRDPTTGTVTPAPAS
ncbi:VOC family protein [Cellulomonas soli]|uniref:Glyoxalase-like domain-containing protein n=1 Tax=Cellulomonas soli TaxID=931535 RepID=A0A512PAT1_9CELL|nr:VOC family protein [Cellulomonas soli]NYI57421.1 hypothetical protein [Cellulomonas soli]GEP68298.1 hypothetical protein CSO01_10130 [Cellulomonas soli]